MNAPDPHYWTLNSCFGAFLSIWVHLGPFRYCTKLGAKWANLFQLMQKFVPQSLVRISRNLRSRSTQLDPKLMFSCVSFRLGAFGTISLLHKTRNKTGHTGAINGKVRAMMSSSAPLDPKLMFWCVCFHLGAYETFLLLHETRCEMAQPSAINAKVRATKSRQNFSKRALLIHTIRP